MKAVFIIPVYKRLELTRLCVTRLAEKGKQLGFDVLCVGDKEAKEYCKGAKFYECENDPLSDKLNFALSKCKKYDRVVIWGSDNFATDEVLKPLIESEKDVIGYDSIYFYSNRTKKASLYTTNKMTIGVGRSYSREVLKHFDYELYRLKQNSGLDSLAHSLYSTVFKENVLELKDGYLLDVKHEMNITNPLIVNIGKEVKPFWNDLIVELDRLNLISRGLAKEVATTKESKIVTKSKENEGSSKKPRAKRSKSTNGKTSKK